MAIAFLEFSTAPGQRGRFGLGGREFGFSASDVEFVANATFKAAAHKSNLLLAQVHRARNGGDFSVERPERQNSFGATSPWSVSRDVVDGSERGLGKSRARFEIRAGPAPRDSIS
jgi:hypothetical protein